MKTLVLALCTLILAAPTVANAKQAWVTDKLKITLRSGESTRHKILRELYAGTEMEVISSNPETGFTYVKTAKGHEGYVMSRFVSEQMPPVARVAALESKIRLLESSGDGEEVSILSQTVDELNVELLKLSQDNAALKTQLDQIMIDSGDALKVNGQHLEVLEKNKLLQNELSLMKAENERISSNNISDARINIGLAVVLGMILVLVFQHFTRRKSSSEWI